MENFSALIIGAGNIGACYDTPDSGNVLTYAHALKKNQYFTNFGFVDRDIDKAISASETWGGECFANLSEALNRSFDLAIVAVPDEWHYEVLKQLMGHPVRFIMAEKPVAKTLEEAEDIMDQAHRLEKHVFVNYTRRYLPELRALKQQIQANEFGAYLSGAGYYGKGLLHNGSHLIDLFRLLVGEISEIAEVDRIYDYTATDPTISGIIRARQGGIFSLNGIPSDAFTMFEMDLLFEKSRIRLIDSGKRIEVYELRKDTLFPKQIQLSLSRVIDTDIGNCMMHVVQNITDHMRWGDAMGCTLNDGLAVMRLIEEIGRSNK